VPARTASGLEFVISVQPNQLSVTLPRTAVAASLARRIVDRLGGKVDDALLADLRLLVSELVSNSVKYGDGDVGLKLSVRRDVVRAEIVDDGRGFEPVIQRSDPQQVGGRGLHLVERLAQRWGVFAGRTRVWFELAMPQSAPA
jgi:anti-sigma regulatory factor (Ser/Thr protein kinase)